MFHVKSWRWFSVRVAGLLACDSRVHRHFYTPPEEEPTTDFIDD